MTETPGIYDSRGCVVEVIPAGLDRAITEVLSRHVGRGNAIHMESSDYKKDGLNIHVPGLLEELGKLGFMNAKSRTVRDSIRKLRRQGHMIGSFAAGEGGYYMITGLVEYDEFAAKEYRAKIRDSEETLKIMDAEARERWGPAEQIGLGI
jgi:hypothetical protein